MSALVRLGLLLMVFGLGSLILPMFNMQFRLLMWADSAQPFLGIGLIVAGIAALVLPMVLKSRSAEPAETMAAQPSLHEGTPAQFNAPGQFPQPAPQAQPGQLPQQGI
ncbi:hypothetical protein [Enemella sp. A6]|uniref:hypothetical protein n=1 Tax=Enemella sp. A6 TaxID=3440152 RepID=UPI003EBD44C3